MDFLLGNVLPLAAGLVIGFIFSFINYLITIKADERAAKLEPAKQRTVIFKAFGLRYAINVLALLMVFLLRNVIPLDFTLLMIGTALGLTLPGRFMLVKHQKDVEARLAAEKSEELSE